MAGGRASGAYDQGRVGVAFREFYGGAVPAASAAAAFQGSKLHDVILSEHETGMSNVNDP
jgi:hypothetical protein